MQYSIIKNVGSDARPNVDDRVVFVLFFEEMLSEETCELLSHLAMLCCTGVIVSAIAQGAVLWREVEAEDVFVALLVERLLDFVERRLDQRVGLSAQHRSAHHHDAGLRIAASDVLDQCHVGLLIAVDVVSGC